MKKVINNLAISHMRKFKDIIIVYYQKLFYFYENQLFTELKIRYIVKFYFLQNYKIWLAKITNYQHKNS